MASLADLYSTDNSGSSDRLLSARTGTLNLLQNQQQQGGWAAPAIALVAGQTARTMNEETERKSKVNEFMAMFGKLAAVNGGAAVKLWNTHAKEALGTDVLIDKAERNAGNLKIEFANGKMVVLDSGAGQVLTPGPDGQLQPINEQWLKEFESNYKTTQAAKGSKSKPTTSTEANNIRTQITQLTGRLTEPGKSLEKDRPAIQKEIDALKAQYKKLTGEEYTAAAPAPAPVAPSGSLSDMAPSGIGLGIRGMSGGAPAVAPPAAPSAAATAGKGYRWDSTLKKLVPN